MAVNFVQNGETMQFTAGAAYSSGDVVVIGNQIGVAMSDVASGDAGVAALTGVWSLPKVSGAVITAGQKVLWDVSAGAFDDSLATPATGDVSGCCIAWESAGNGVTSVAVKIGVVAGTVA
jgi:predicted RecA/RadA family phage recombinase